MSCEKIQRTDPFAVNCKACWLEGHFDMPYVCLDFIFEITRYTNVWNALHIK